MANDSVGAIPFFMTNSTSSTGARDNASDALLNQTGSSSNQANDSFTQALNTAQKNTTREEQNHDYSDSINRADARSRQSSSMAHRMDKPKVGNREPFFPHKPMPYHPDSQSQARDTVNPMVAQAVQTKPAPQVMSPADLEAVHDEISDIDNEGIRGDVPVRGTLRAGQGVIIDDQDGVMSDSYEGMAVSYPVSRIAAESLDEDTKNSLKEKGLWNAPTMVMAKPSAKLAAMQSLSANGEAAGVQVAKPIAQFMASLENELGVSPDRLVQAFHELPPGQLMKSPEQTMVQIVKNLGLDKEDEAKALNLYSKMLAQMQMMEGNDKLANAGLIGGGLTGAKIEGQVENAAASMQSENPVGSLPQGSMLKGREMTSMNSTKPESARDVSGMTVGNDQSQAFENYGLKNVEMKSQTPGANQQNAQDQSRSGGQNLAQQFAGGNAFAQAQAQAQTAAARHEGSVKDQVKFDLKHDLAANDVKGLGQAHVTNDASQVQLQGPQNDVKNLQTLGAVSGTGAAHEMKLNAQARNEAIQSIMNHTQALAAKGGGEMKLTLRPDHLGEIQLKVAMADGNRVSVQMTTEKSEVKKLLEQSVHELRHGLAQHNLSMEKIDVSLSNKDAGGFQRGQPDLGQARDFANQFHQQQQNSRREIMDGFAAMRSMSGPRMGVDMAHRAESALASARAMKGSGKLNVVA